MEHKDQRETNEAFVSENVLTKFSKEIKPQAITVEYHVETPIVARAAEGER